MNVDEARAKVRALKQELNELKPSIVEANRALTMYVALARRVGAPTDLIEFVSRMQQARIAAEMAYRSILQLYAGAGPIGWALGLGTLALSGAMFYDVGSELSSH